MRARKIFQRLKNYVIYRINATVQILIFMSISALMLTEICDASWAPGQCKPGTQFTMPAIVLVIIAIVNDFTIMSIAYDNVHPSTKPESWKLFEITFVSCTLGFYGVLETYLVYASLSSGKDNQGGPRLIFEGLAPMGNKSHAAVYLALAVGGQLSVFAARTHKFFFSRRPGYCLAVSVFGGFLVNLMLGSHNWLWIGGQEGLSWEETGRILLYLVISFVVKDLLKVAAYSMVAYDPFMDWKEHDVSSNTTRINARKRTIFGTLNDMMEPARDKRTMEPRVSGVDPAREARRSEARMRRVSHADMHRSICEDETFGA